MADIKTHLRELSVAFSFCDNSKEKLNPIEFLKFCKENVIGTNKLELRDVCNSPNTFNKEELGIINRGIDLGININKYVLRNQSINSFKWTGLETQSGSVVDLIINDYGLSLKEKSDITENMGLYKYLNLIFNTTKHKRGLHCFETFAPEQLELWYQAARNSIIKGLDKPFELIKNGKLSKAILSNDNLELSYNGDKRVIENFRYSTYSDFKKSLNGKLKEKVFSKMIRKYSESDDDYKKIKKNCAIKAGKIIVSLLNERIGEYPNVHGWFRIIDEEYYYCKVTENSMSIFKVPEKSAFTKSIIINKIESVVPEHQLNIITTLKNNNNNQIFQFRNECRYSHGQLNGTPEAKCYIVNDNLEFAYQRIL